MTELLSNYAVWRKAPACGEFTLLCTPPNQAKRGWAGCIVFLYYLMTCTYRVRKTESTFKENSGYLGLLQLKWYYMY